ncbi:hypothetical protein [Azospirillum tabaci]|uniref:hypothetical protein n=1 Tax=Azospirillum tabaci TaxID=2752310 RepID=UPI00166146EA|nr:hypothetical protein [Azospirillum tabaci]
MTAGKPDATMAHLTPEARSALRAPAKEDGRSIAGELDWLILQETERRGRPTKDRFEPRLVARNGTIPRGSLWDGGGG